jgi:hypothetical protein
MASGSAYNYTLRYKDFNSLLSDVRVDFSNYALENLIDPAQLIRVARKCNYDLGLRIHQTKEALLDIEKGRVRLPESFHSMNFALMCGSHTETFVVPQGTHLEEKLIPKVRSVPATMPLCDTPIVCSNCHLVPCGCGTVVLQTATSSCGCGANPCSCPSTNVCEGAVFNPKEPGGDWWKQPRVFLNCKGDCVEVIQKVNTGTRHYNHLYPLRFINNAQGIECGCPGLYMRSEDEAWIKDGWLYTTFHHNNGCGQVYVNYEGEMEDEDGNLLVPDHPLLIEYYEYSLKARILENLLLNGEDVAQKLQLMEERRKVAKGAAKSVVQMPNWNEMREMYVVNRKAQWSKYYSQFATQTWFDYYAASGASLSR